MREKVEDLEGVLLKAEKFPIFHSTLRTFGDYPPLKYFSLKLSEVSLESIVWILKSIVADKMKPTESLI